MSESDKVKDPHDTRKELSKALGCWCWCSEIEQQERKGKEYKPPLL